MKNVLNTGIRKASGHDQRPMTFHKFEVMGWVDGKGIMLSWWSWKGIVHYEMCTTPPLEQQKRSYLPSLQYWATYIFDELEQIEDT